MRIGINASFFKKQNTGIGQVTVNFLRKLTDLSSSFSNHRDLTFFLYLEESLPVEFKLPENFHSRDFLPMWKRDDLIRKIWWEKYLLPKKIKQDNCDVFISLYQSATILSGVKHIMVVHDIIPRLFPEYLNNSRKKIYWKLTEKAMKKAEKIVTVSSRTEKDLIKYLGMKGEKISVNYIGADEIYNRSVSSSINEKVLKKYKLTPGYIYHGGGLDTRKNTEKVLCAYKMLREKNKEEHFLKNFPILVISGKLMPEMAPLITDAEKIARDLNISPYVKFLGFVEQGDLPVIYKNASLFIYPSLYEGFGLPVLEAMSLGVPVITSKISSLPEVGGDSVLYCNPRDPRDIMMVMKNILTNNHLRETLSVRGRKRAEIFSCENFTKKLLNSIL